jgi:hypothetical protein
VTTLVAIEDGRVVGAIQVQSDGLIQAHVSLLLMERVRGHAWIETRRVCAQREDEDDDVRRAGLPLRGAIRLVERRCRRLGCCT